MRVIEEVAWSAIQGPLNIYRWITIGILIIGDDHDANEE
jgi:hypothetical protein